MLANDTDPNGDVLSVTSVGNAAHGTVKLVNGNIVFTADANFSGIAKFDYTVSDGYGGTSTATATVDVKPVADTPTLSVVAGAPVKVGVEILVNTAIKNDQVTSTITALANGGFVVAWDDSSGQGGDASSNSIKAQIFDASGNKLNGELLVNTTTAGAQTLPTITSLKNGGFIATWTDASGLDGDASSTSVKAQIFDANGAKVGNEFLVNTSTAGAQQDSAVTELMNGGFVVTWQDGSTIKAQVLNATGGKVGTELLVGIEFVPSIAPLPNGGFVIAWQDNSGQGGDLGVSVKAQIFDANGGKIGGEFLANTVTAGVQAHPSVTTLNNGNFVVTWHDGNGLGGDPDSSIRAQIFTSTGATVGNEFLVNTTTANAQQFPSIAALTNGGFVVVWEDLSGQGGDASGSSIKAQAYDSFGNKVGGEFLVNTATPSDQQISFAGAVSGTSVSGLPNGGFVVTWQDSQRPGRRCQRDVDQGAGLHACEHQRGHGIGAEHQRRADRHRWLGIVGAFHLGDSGGSNAHRRRS